MAEASAASAAASAEIPLFKVFMAPPSELDGPVTQVLHSGFVTQGPKVEEFESQMRAFLQSRFVLSLNSATSGIHLALHMLKKKDGPDQGHWPGLVEHVDEVLTCPLTCTATNWPILANGYIPTPSHTPATDLSRHRLVPPQTCPATDLSCYRLVSPQTCPAPDLSRHRLLPMYAHVSHASPQHPRPPTRDSPSQAAYQMGGRGRGELGDVFGRSRSKALTHHQGTT